jgi:hypothetical protein
MRCRNTSRNATFGRGHRKTHTDSIPLYARTEQQHQATHAPLDTFGEGNLGSIFNSVETEHCRRLLKSCSESALLFMINVYMMRNIETNYDFVIRDPKIQSCAILVIDRKNK